MKALIGSPAALRMEPAIDPPDDEPEEEEPCPECGEPMRLIESGLRRGFFWIRAKCTNRECGYVHEDNNFE